MLQRFLCTLLLLTGAAEAQEADVVWMRGGGHAYEARWAPDGATFALGGGDGTIKVFDGESRLLLQTIRAHDLEVTELAYAPDGQRLAANGERYTSGSGWTFVVGVWDRATGEAVWTAPVATRVFGVDVSADGAVVAVGHRQGVSLYDAATGALMQTLVTPREVKDVRFSPDGQHLAAGALMPYFAREIWLWRTSDWGLARTLTDGPGYPELAFSPDGSLLAAAGEFESFTSIRGEIKLWDVATGQLVRTINMGETNTGAEGPGFSPDGQRVFAGHPFLGVKIYEVATGALVSHVPNTPSIRVAPDGQTFLGQPDRGCDTRGARWAAFSFPAGQVLDEFMTHTGTASNLDISPDGSRIATAGSDDFARLWDAATTAPLRAFDYGCVSATLDEVTFSPDGATVAGGGLCWECEIKLWDLATGQETVLPLGHRRRVSALAFSPAGTEIASGSAHVTSYVITVPDGFLVHSIGTGAVRNLAYSGDGALLAFGTWSNGIRIADAVTGATVRTIANPHAGSVRRVAFTPDGALLASSGDDGLVRVWDVAGGSLVRTIEAHGGPVMALALTPDGRHAVSGGTGAAGPAKLWDLATGALLHTYDEETARMTDVEFFPDGATFAFLREDASLGVARVPGVVTSTEPRPSVGFALSAPVPNPVRGRTAVSLTLDRAQAVAVAVYDAMGRRVAVLHEGPLAAGAHALTLDAAALPAGVYVVRAAGEGTDATRRLVVAR